MLGRDIVKYVYDWVDITYKSKLNSDIFLLVVIDKNLCFSPSKYIHRGQTVSFVQFYHFNSSLKACYGLSFCFNLSFNANVKGWISSVLKKPKKPKTWIHKNNFLKRKIILKYRHPSLTRSKDIKDSFNASSMKQMKFFQWYFCLYIRS